MEQALSRRAGIRQVRNRLTAEWYGLDSQSFSATRCGQTGKGQNLRKCYLS
jgi:hypothetical protein